MGPRHSREPFGFVGRVEVEHLPWCGRIEGKDLEEGGREPEEEEVETHYGN